MRALQLYGAMLWLRAPLRPWPVAMAYVLQELSVNSELSSLLKSLRGTMQFHPQL